MRRYPLVLGGTVAGIAGVLAFPVHGTHLSVSSASSGVTSGSTTASGATSGSATTTAPAPTTTPAPAATAGGSTATTAPATAPTTSAVRTATSAAQSFRYGDIALSVTVSGSKITNVKVTSLDETDGRSANIDSYAVPQLEQQVISAGSANVNGVSGATFTSQAFVDAVTSALDKLGLKA